MSLGREDLVTDSVPEAPRDPSSLTSINSTESEENANKTSAKKPDEHKDNEQRNQSLPKSGGSKNPSKSHSHFGSNSIPNFFSSGSSNVICISNATNVHVGNTLSINYVGSSSHPKPQKTSFSSESQEELSTFVKEAFASQVEVTLEELDEVAEHVGAKWERLGARLGFSKGQLERLFEEHKHIGLKEVSYQMLLMWKQSQGRKAQMGILCQTLWETGHCAAAEKVASLSQETKTTSKTSF